MVPAWTNIGNVTLCHAARRRRSVVVQQAFWALMLLGHLPAWIALSNICLASADQAHLLRWGLLTLSQVFFVLKYADVPWLRLPNERRTLIAFTVIIALLHAGPVERAWSSTPETGLIALPATCIGGMLLTWTCGLRRPAPPGARRPRTMRRFTRARLHEILDRVSHALLPPRFLLLTGACHVNRAPPF